MAKLDPYRMPQKPRKWSASLVACGWACRHSSSTGLDNAALLVEPALVSIWFAQISVQIIAGASASPIAIWDVPVGHETRRVQSAREARSWSGPLVGGGLKKYVAVGAQS